MQWPPPKTFNIRYELMFLFQDSLTSRHIVFYFKALLPVLARTLFPIPYHPHSTRIVNLKVASLFCFQNNYPHYSLLEPFCRLISQDSSRHHRQILRLRAYLLPPPFPLNSQQLFAFFDPGLFHSASHTLSIQREYHWLPIESGKKKEVLPVLSRLARSSALLFVVGDITNHYAS